ncbi:MarR family transcriptional regulator [Deinococcus sp.]|uniref:MarR family winged helix-turn-helix transcriptional regulator n=1 Tax=Deinococcus sp. TaxID=47478 RepID=UPI002869868B|nr:MarR family transcriptional regulator [Deinococcus sp.]
MDADFNTEEKSAWGGLLGLYARMSRLIETDLQTNFGVSHVEFEILLRLSKAPKQRLRLQDIAEKSLLTRSGTSRAVERLERAGLLQRSQAREDHRGAYATLTVQGMQLFTTALQAHVALVRHHFFAAFDEQQQQQLGLIWKQWERHQAGLTNPVRDGPIHTGKP